MVVRAHLFELTQLLERRQIRQLVITLKRKPPIAMTVVDELRPEATPYPSPTLQRKILKYNPPRDNRGGPD
jgi:hypothetical protein